MQYLLFEHGSYTMMSFHPMLYTRNFGFDANSQHIGYLETEPTVKFCHAVARGRPGEGVDLLEKGLGCTLAE